MPKPPLTDEVADFLRRPNYATISVVRPDGQPVSVPTWYLFEDGQVVVNMDAGRKRLDYLRADPRISLSAMDPDNWITHVSLQGRVAELVDDHDLVDIDRIARHYTGQPYAVRDRAAHHGPDRRRPVARVGSPARRPVSWRVERDPNGIPHLWADDVLELARAQGRVTAIDRAWQIEHQRWRMEGRTAEHVGPAGVAWDTFARQVRLEQTVRRSYEALDEETQAWLRAYVAGVDEGLPEGLSRAAEIEAARARAPLLLRLARGQPWTPLGIFWAIHLLFGTFPYKLFNGHVADTVGPHLLPLINAEGLDGREGVEQSGQQRLGGRRGAHGVGCAAARRRPAPHHRAAGLLPAGGPGLPGVRRRGLHLPRGARRPALRPCGVGGVGHHQRDGRLPGPDDRVAAGGTARGATARWRGPTCRRRPVARRSRRAASDGWEPVSALGRDDRRARR